MDGSPIPKEEQSLTFAECYLIVPGAIVTYDRGRAEPVISC